MDEQRKKIQWMAILAVAALLVWAFFAKPESDSSGVSSGESPAEAFDAYQGGQNPSRPTPGKGEGTSASAAKTKSSQARSPAPSAPSASQPGQPASSQPNAAPRPPERVVPKARPRPQGVLKQEEVQLGIKAFKPVARFCYEQLLEDFPEASGKVVLHFTVQALEGYGEVVMSEVDPNKTEVHEKFFHDCLTTKISAVEFETEHTGATDVSYPFLFEREKPTPKKQVFEPGLEEEVQFDEPGGEPEPKEADPVEDYAPR